MANDTPAQFAELRAKREQGVREYCSRIGRYSENVMRFAVAIVNGESARGSHPDPKEVIEYARFLAGEIDSEVYAQGDVLCEAALETNGVQFVKSIPKYITPGAEGATTERKPEAGAS